MFVSGRSVQKRWTATCVLMFYVTRCGCLHTLRTVGIMDVHQEISRSVPLIAVSVTVLQHNKIILEILH